MKKKQVTMDRCAMEAIFQVDRFEWTLMELGKVSSMMRSHPPLNLEPQAVDSQIMIVHLNHPDAIQTVLVAIPGKNWYASFNIYVF